MKNDDLDAIWTEIETSTNHRNSLLQRLVYVDLLWRVYIGSHGIPSKRFLSIEIPKEDADKFDAFNAPQGFTLSIGEPGVEHKGYVACVLQSTSSDQNDVFSILAKDILEELCKEDDSNKYINSLKNRVVKWRDFFKNQVRTKLSDKTIIGLIGELTFIKDLEEAGVNIISDFWNGPISSAQDFQGKSVAVEVKTSVSNSIECVHISSEEQLDTADREKMFLVVYRVEHNDANGVTLPALVENVANLLTERQRMRFFAKLLCIGYIAEDANLYNEAYLVREQRAYAVKEEFPRLVRADLPKGVAKIKYQLLLQDCEQYRVQQLYSGTT